jgi:drug efflux transport system permease protein
MRTIFHIIRKEYQQLRRDPTMLRLTFLSPVIQLLILGYAASLDVSRIPLVVCDMDHTRSSRELVSKFTSSGTFKLVCDVPNINDIDHQIDDGHASMALVIPRGFGASIAGNRTVQVQVIADGSESNSAVIGLSYASIIVASYSQAVGLQAYTRLRNAGLKLASVNPETRIWYNPAVRSRNYMVPGVLAMVLMLTTMLLTSLAVVREKEIGTMEQLLVTPIKPWQLLIGKLAPFSILGLIDIIIVLAIATLWFHVPLKGSIPLLLLLCFIFELTTLGLGLLISTISRNQQQAMMTSQFFIMQPMMQLSGFAFPIENMPKVIQFVTNFIPLRYFMSIIRGIFLKGSGFRELWPNALALLIFGLVIFIISVNRFQKKLG